VFLRSLELRGFKSFADRTVLDFEPGVTVVVGPNGSGKSNLVDAVAWVLGAQGPRTLRGGRMDDFIFAGSGSRPALGRSEVSLTIDNSAGLLPIEFSEVSITRRLFRDGESEYELNGAPCRLLDIQELLSDTGIGRQQHVIVGQGQLDTILNARPEDRRAVIEEAAGILKYRRRRERAERRLETSEGNLLRIQDLLREVRRQLVPLRRQADAAQRHAGLEAERRAIRLYLAGHELAGLQTRLEKRRDRHAQLEATAAESHRRLHDLDEEVFAVERSLTSLGDDDLADAQARVSALRERSRGLQALVSEKHRNLERELAAAADEGVVQTLVADAVGLRGELADVEAEVAGLAPEAANLDASAAEMEARRTELATDGGAPETEATAADRAWQEAAAEAARLRARAEALAAALGATRADVVAGVPGVVGLLAELLDIDPGAEVAVEAALGEAMQAVVVDGGDAARAALDRMATGDAGALLLVLQASASTASQLAPPAGTKRVREFVRATNPRLDGALHAMLNQTVLVDDVRRAVDVALEHPGLVAVTPSGERVGGAGPWRLGRRPLTERAVAAAAERASEAEAEAAAAAERASVAEAVAAAAETRRDAARREAEAADANRRAARAELEERLDAIAHQRRELAVRTGALDERRAGLERRLAQVESRLSGRDPQAQSAAERQRSDLLGRSEAYRRVQHALVAHATAIETLHEQVQERRRRQSETARASGERLDVLRRERAELEEELGAARELLGRTEIEEAETKLRLETAIERLRAEFDCEPAQALDAPAPEVPEGTTPAARARELERELRLMGPINPLAIREYEELQERVAFLESQLEDVRATRRELRQIIRAVDREIVKLFETAFADVSRHFSDLFHTLFPGGSGSLSLVDSEDLLNTGIEIAARPSGKTVRRLSLLSGGERSLTALAFLFSVFRARPSPFYLLDEVEAALDDVNLHRFLDLVREFRDEAQLVIVSHQKRTMEAADSLYGVSMPPGGSSVVVSQRLSEVVTS
jgi:chromosome segregation protein